MARAAGPARRRTSAISVSNASSSAGVPVKHARSGASSSASSAAAPAARASESTTSAVLRRRRRLRQPQPARRRDARPRRAEIEQHDGEAPRLEQALGAAQRLARLPRAHPQHALEHDAGGLRRGGVEGVGAVGHGDHLPGARGLGEQGERERGAPAGARAGDLAEAPAREAAAQQAVELGDARRAAGERLGGQAAPAQPGTELAQQLRHAASRPKSPWPRGGRAGG